MLQNIFNRKEEMIYYVNIMELLIIAIIYGKKTRIFLSKCFFKILTCIKFDTFTISNILKNINVKLIVDLLLFSSL